MSARDVVIITDKGSDELVNRTNRLDLRKRSVLISLATAREARTVSDIVNKSVCGEDEVLKHVAFLRDGGYVSIETREPVVMADITLDGKIAVPRAKFQLIEFCKQNFESMESRIFINEIKACKSKGELVDCIVSITSYAKSKSEECNAALNNLMADIDM